ncbi:MAG: hypothetical protein FJ279_35580, partial [Planctomycetes bacterium]|nr:hypothetical protein [Planctomycetota bacterium]
GNSYLEFAPKGNIGGSACTICLWFRPRDWGAKKYDNILGLSADNVNAFHLERSHPGGQLRLVLGGPDTADGAKTRSLFSREVLQNDRWVHIAACWDAAAPRVELFVDGKSVAKNTQPGPTPLNVPVFLVGAGFGRLGRAIKGDIDELRVYDRALAEEEIAKLMTIGAETAGRVELRNDALSAIVDCETGTLTVGEIGDYSGRFVLGPMRAAVNVGGKSLTWPRFSPSAPTTPLATRLGPASALAFKAEGAEHPLTLTYHVQAQKTLPLMLVWAEVQNTGKENLKVNSISLMEPAQATPLVLGVSPQRLRIFLDSGGLGGSGVRAFSQPSAQHLARGAMVLHDLEEDNAASFSFVTFRTAGVSTRIATDATGAPTSAQATCDYPSGCQLDPGERLTSEVLAIGFHPGGHAALESWADTVMAVNDLKPPKFRPTGYNSWYAYRLEISEDLVLQNARIMKERWPTLGLEYFQIDHGWQYKDVVGHWTPNERFPHGLPWLSAELQKMGFKLGLWLAVTQVSEHAPLFAEHSEALMHNADGSPVVASERWFWKPHGKTFTLDPTHPLGAKFYEDTGKALWEFGCRYAKNDFQTNIMHGSAVLHDKRI